MREGKLILMYLACCMVIILCHTVVDSSTLNNDLYIKKATAEYNGNKQQKKDIKQSLKQHYISENALLDRLHDLAYERDQQKLKSSRKASNIVNTSHSGANIKSTALHSKGSSILSKWNLPKINFRCDPLINFKLKQRLILLGTCVTLGMDYLSDISQWRSYCAIEDTFVQGRFSLRGSELGWAKSWLLNLGLGEEQTAKFKLRIGLNLKSYKAYAKLRFRTEPISPFDIGDGISCAGKLPLPLFMLPMLRTIPLRIEYRLRVNTATPYEQRGQRRMSQEGGGLHHHKQRSNNNPNSRLADQNNKVSLTTGLGSLDLSLEELNFCLEWDEKSPLWGVGLVKGGRPSWKSYSPSSSSSSNNLGD